MRVRGGVLTFAAEPKEAEFRLTRRASDVDCMVEEKMEEFSEQKESNG